MEEYFCYTNDTDGYTFPGYSGPKPTIKVSTNMCPKMHFK